MSARILNFILKYGFLPDKDGRNSTIYSQAQKLYSQLPAINLSTRLSMFGKGAEAHKDGEKEKDGVPHPDTFEFDKMEQPDHQIKLKKFEDIKENGEEAYSSSEGQNSSQGATEQ